MIVGDDRFSFADTITLAFSVATPTSNACVIMTRNLMSAPAPTSRPDKANGEPSRLIILMELSEAVDKDNVID